MHILIDLRLLTKGGATGIEEYTTQLVGHLLTLDQKNKYTLFYNGLRKAPLPREWLERSNTSLVDRHIPNKLFDLLNRFNLPKLDAIAKSDAIFSPHFNIISRDSEIPHVMTFHDLSFIHHPEFFPMRKKFWHWLQKYQDRAKRASRIIAVSEFTKWDLVECLNIKPEKIVTIYSGIQNELKPMPRKSQGRPFMLYLGAIEPRKNVSAAIRAFNILKTSSKFRDWQFVIAGNFGWLYQDVLKESEQSPYRDDIRFIGKIHPSDRVFIYNLAELFIYPSFFEGFGFPPLEAQACGIPVVASDRTSLPEILGDSALLVNPWKIDDIVSAAQSIVFNPGERERLISAGFENVKRFNWVKTASKTLEVLTATR